MGVGIFVDVGDTAAYMIPTTVGCDDIDIVNFKVLIPCTQFAMQPFASCTCLYFLFLLYLSCFLI